MKADEDFMSGGIVCLACNILLSLLAHAVLDCSCSRPLNHSHLRSFPDYVQKTAPALQSIVGATIGIWEIIHRTEYIQS